METCLSIEGKLNIVLSTKFRCFWDAHIIEDAVDFQVARAALGPGEFGTVEALEGSDFEWEIDIRDDLNDLETEITLAHELMHVLLHHQGHPAICLSDKCGVQASILMGRYSNGCPWHPLSPDHMATAGKVLGK